jgi:hypothetical protein
VGLCSKFDIAHSLLLAIDGLDLIRAKSGRYRYWVGGNPGYLFDQIILTQTDFQSAKNMDHRAGGLTVSSIQPR